MHIGKSLYTDEHIYFLVNSFYIKVNSYVNIIQAWELLKLGHVSCQLSNLDHITSSSSSIRFYNKEENSNRTAKAAKQPEWLSYLHTQVRTATPHIQATRSCRPRAPIPEPRVQHVQILRICRKLHENPHCTAATAKQVCMPESNFIQFHLNQTWPDSELSPTQA